MDYTLSADLSSASIAGYETCMAGDNILRDENNEPILDSSGDWILTGGCGRIVLPTQTFALTCTGAPATFAATETIHFTLDPKAFAYTGFAMIPKLGRVFAADAGVATIAGVANKFLRGLTTIAYPGSVTITGVAMTPKLGLMISADPSSATITGFDMTPKLGRVFAADPAAVTITGADMTPVVMPKILADPGEVAIVGVAAEMSHQGLARELFAEAGSVTLQGFAATAASARFFAADASAATITGSEATLDAVRQMAAYPASIEITGASSWLSQSMMLNALPAEMAVVGANAWMSMTKVLHASPAELVVSVAGTWEFLDRKLQALPSGLVITGAAAGLSRVMGAMSADPQAFSVALAAAYLHYVGGSSASSTAVPAMMFTKAHCVTLFTKPSNVVLFEAPGRLPLMAE